MHSLGRRFFLAAFSHRSGQRGQSAVEIALVLPLLLLILFGIIISVFMLQAYDQVSNAAREGARAGSMYRATRAISGLSLDQTVQKAIYDSGTGLSALGGLPTTSPSFNVGSDVVVSLTTSAGTASSKSDPQPGDRIRVRITYRYTLPVVSQALPMFPQPIVIVRDVVMEVQ